jgi:hypothetical protein
MVGPLSENKIFWVAASLFGNFNNFEKIPYFDLREPLIIINLSLPRRRESSDVKSFWIPAFAEMTFLEVALIQPAFILCEIFT